MNVETSLFGYFGGEKVDLITISSEAGQIISITNFGGIVHSWLAPNREGTIQDVLLGCRDLEGYKRRHPYFGAIIGRYGNRIGYGKFSINGEEFQLHANLPPHHLHGGIDGFDRKIWQYTIEHHDSFVCLTLSRQSPHMEEGYPGNLDVEVKYTFDNEGRLSMEYTAYTDRDTHLNLTNHCYFNLSGDTTNNILHHQLSIVSDSVTATDESLIPNGLLESLDGSPLDFRVPKLIGQDIFNDVDVLTKAKGYDHNYVLDQHPFEVAIATAVDMDSGRRLQVFTTEPAVQLYTGNWLAGVAGKSGEYQDYSGFCLETQHYPDTPNHPHFPTTLLRKGETYYSKTMYMIDVVPSGEILLH